MRAARRAALRQRVVPPTHFPIPLFSFLLHHLPPTLTVVLFTSRAISGSQDCSQPKARALKEETFQFPPPLIDTTLRCASPPGSSASQSLPPTHTHTASLLFFLPSSSPVDFQLSNVLHRRRKPSDAHCPPTESKIPSTRPLQPPSASLPFVPALPIPLTGNPVPLSPPRFHHFSLPSHRMRTGCTRPKRLGWACD